MNLSFNKSLINQYKSASQISRVITEDWVSNNIYCTNCGNDNLSSFENNRPVADFFCANCKEEFELKSKKGSIGRKVIDGAYSTMIDRITAENNPNFFFLTYDKNDLSVTNFLIIPKHFFVTNLIEKRNPLSQTAIRAGWVGCNICINQIPKTGKLFIVKNSLIVDKSQIINQWDKTKFLRKCKLNSKGWLIDILNCIDLINEKEFKLEQVYKFEEELQLKYPQNNFIKDKIRQQLQVLRDKGIIKFISRGVYAKI